MYKRQAENYADTGRVALFTCNADGTLTFDKVYETGVQPDMVTFASNDSKILTADEGEPRDGYGDGIIDPKGTVTIINLADQTVSQVDFTSVSYTHLPLVSSFTNITQFCISFIIRIVPKTYPQSQFLNFSSSKWK